MLLKAVAALKADKGKTLDLINKGEGGFLDRDLYVFCANASDGKTVAIGNPNAKQVMGGQGLVPVHHRGAGRWRYPSDQDPRTARSAFAVKPAQSAARRSGARVRHRRAI